MAEDTALPPKEKKSEQRVVEFFNNYFNKTLEFSANDFDAVVGFFTKRDFDKTAAISVSQALLTQAKLDEVNVFQLLDTLKGFDEVQLSKVVTQVLNFYRRAHVHMLRKLWYRVRACGALCEGCAHRYWCCCL